MKLKEAIDTRLPSRETSSAAAPKVKLKELIKRARALAKPFRVTEGDSFRLDDVDPGDTLAFTSEDKPRAKKALAMGINPQRDESARVQGGCGPEHCVHPIRCLLRRAGRW